MQISRREIYCFSKASLSLLLFFSFQLTHFPARPAPLVLTVLSCQCMGQAIPVWPVFTPNNHTPRTRTQFLKHRLLFVSGSSCGFPPEHRLQILHCPSLNYYKKSSREKANSDNRVRRAEKLAALSDSSSQTTDVIPPKFNYS